MEKVKINILPHYFLNDDGTFDKNGALHLSGQIGGICYSKDGFDSLKVEDSSKTERRIKATLSGGHHSVYDHILLNLDIQNIPKMLAIVLNNEKQYTTSEKSLRYTEVKRTKEGNVTLEEEELYNKWMHIFESVIKEKYGYIYSDKKIKKLAQENARYLISVFTKTEMIYSATLRQLNYLASWINNYISSPKGLQIDKDLLISMKEFLEELDRLNILVPELMTNDKNRKLSLFGDNLKDKKPYFGDVYSTTYFGSLAQFGQIQRHRTLNYSLEFLPLKQYYIPEIILDDKRLTEMWLSDISKLKGLTLQGEMVLINERGTYENFILKCKERLCAEVQLETMRQTKKTLEEYRDNLTDDVLINDIQKYTKGARCTFPDYTCSSDCHFNEGKTLVRKI